MLRPLHSRFVYLAPAIVGIQLLGLSASSPAAACGGFFCSAQNPVNQAAERIIFAQDADGTITQVVEILYEGPAERFAWVLPVPGTPEAQISSSLAFDRLQNTTNPLYVLNDTFPDECNFSGVDGSTGTGGTTGSPNAEGGGVIVLDAGSVGPFDYETIQVDAADEDPADVALRWLEDNGYDVSNLGPEVLRPYLANGLNLMAFRLQKGNLAGSIRPISLTYKAENPAIPIRPTAVAANDDMGVMVWVLGSSRAVPMNYKGLELNEMYIDWINGGSNYGDVVTRAADEAEGQGFVTELAEAAERFADVIEPQFDALDPQAYDSGNVEQTLTELTFRYGQYDGYTDVIREHATLRAPLTAEDFVSCPGCYFDPDSFGDVNGVDYGSYNPETDPILTTNPEEVLSSVQTDVLDPIAQTAELFRNHAYVTRLYTTMSAEEMTKDPFFDFNPDLDDVSNIHTAERLLTCDGPGGPWRVTLADGRRIYGEGFEWPLLPSDSSEAPYNTRILEFSTTGQPLVVQDNQATIRERFEGSDPSTPNEAEPIQSEGSGCSYPAGIGASGYGYLLALLGAASLSLRRRRSA